MNSPQEPGLFFSLDDLKILFSSLKAFEENLDLDAEILLSRIEKILYDYLSIREIESLSQSGRK